MTVIIPSHPEIEMTAVKKHLPIRILECNRGGFIVIYGEHGMSACSSWDEVLDAINTAGADLLGVERMRLPTMYDGDRGGRLDPQEEREPISMRSALNAITIAITTVAASAIAAISVKIA